LGIRKPTTLTINFSVNEKFTEEETKNTDLKKRKVENKLTWGVKMDDRHGTYGHNMKGGKKKVY